jgi:hypothetical protein
VDSELSRQQLIDLYRTSLDEYRFEVRLNWDRMQYYLVLNLGIIAAATGLAKVGSGEPLRLLTALIFLAGIGTCYLGIDAIIRGHNLYRAALHQKTALEALLGLLEPTEVHPLGHGRGGLRVPLAVATTPRQRRGYALLRERDEWDPDAPLSHGSIVRHVTRALALLAAVDALGVALTCLPDVAAVVGWPLATVLVAAAWASVSLGAVWQYRQRIREWWGTHRRG